jgi:hypothetical protein
MEEDAVHGKYVVSACTDAVMEVKSTLYEHKFASTGMRESERTMYKI